MKKNRGILLFIIAFSIIFLSSCIAGLDDYYDANMDESFSQDAECIMQDGSNKKISIKTFYDEVDNPIYDTYHSIAFYPLKDVEHYHFDYAEFEIFLTGDRSYDEVIIKVTIEDLVIEYETVYEEVVNEDGTVDIIEKQVEKSRHTEIKDLTNGGEKFKANGTSGQTISLALDYDILDYSSSTCFKFSLFETDGITPFQGEWAMDELYIVVYNENVDEIE